MSKPTVIHSYGFSCTIYTPETHNHIKKLRKENKNINCIVKSVNRNKRLRLIDKKTRYRV